MSATSNLTDEQVNRYFDFVYGWYNITPMSQRHLLSDFFRHSDITLKDVQHEMCLRGLDY